MGERSSKDLPPGVADTIPTAASPEVVSSTVVTLAPPGVRSTVLPRVARGADNRRMVLEGKPRYEALEHLGSGGQAEVTLARDHDIDRQVALKRLRPEISNEDAVLRFAEEIRTVGQLEHPNIVPIHDVGVDHEGQYFFVMKYVDGETLESIITKLRAGDARYLGKYTPEYRLQICNEILRGVEHAHQLGILHRDLKPGNVMVGSLGEVVIMDWGLAKRLGDAEPARRDAPAPTGGEPARMFETQAGALLGTPAYMAPEQAAGRLDAVDARSDVYSLSVMFYEFLCLRHPRAHCTTIPAMVSSVMDEPISKNKLLADFLAAKTPAALGHFVRHGLEHDPAQRYQSVAAMRERLDSIRDGHVPVECPVTLAQSLLDGVARGANRHPYLLLFTYLVLALGLVGGVLSIWKLLHH
jgi:serine/threonine-protein kinase